MEIIEHENHTVCKLQSGKTLAMGTAPATNEAAEARMIIRRSLDALGALEDAKRAAIEDKTLSDIGRAQKIEPILDAAVTAIADAAAKLDEFGEFVGTDETATFQPPALDKADAVAGLHDMELRTLMRALSGDDLHKFMATMKDQPRVIEAILRSPLDMGILTVSARALWSQRIQSINPHAKELQHAREAADWAHSVLPHIAKHTTDGTDGAVRTQLLDNLTKRGKTAHAELFGFSASEIQIAIRRASMSE